MKVNRTVFQLWAAALLAAVAGCGRQESEDDIRISTAADLADRACGVLVGSMMGDMTRQVEPRVRLSWFNDYNSAVEALRLRRIDALPLDAFFAGNWVKNSPAAYAMTEPYGSIPWGFIFRKGDALKDRVNAVLEKMRASGELETLIRKWTTARDVSAVSFEKLDFRRDFTGRAGVFRFATPADREPISFVRPDGIVGFDIEIARRLAYELDMTLELLTVPMGAIVPAMQSGKADMAGGGIAITRERAEKVDFSACYHRMPAVFLIRRTSHAAATREIRSLADLEGRICAVVTGSAVDTSLPQRQKGVRLAAFNDYPSAIEALRLGRVDAIPMDTVVVRQWVAANPDDFRIACSFDGNPMGYLFKRGSELTARVNRTLAEMKRTGELKRIIDKWCSADNLAAVPAERIDPSVGKAGTLRIATNAVVPPGMFMRGDEFAGFDVDILRRVAAALDMKVEFVNMEISAVVPAVESGTVTMGGGCITITAERARRVDFTDCYIDLGHSVLVRREKAPGRRSGGGVQAWFRSLGESFHRTFVVEGRWRMMAHGLGVTLFIAFFASLLGTLLAFPVWLCRTARNRLVRALARAYVAILQGTPVLVLLMVLYYIVFSSVDIDGVWVAVIGFALNASAYIGEALRSGIASVPDGQTEAALALGYRPCAAFLRFVLPQAARAILPVYRGELVGLLKATSVVGYIAISDLNKASDLIRSRTYESFFPILTTAFIYFVAAWLLALALDRLGRRLDPACRRLRTVSQDKEGVR